MSDADKSKRDRSPSFPYVGLEKAVERTRMLFAKAKRHEVRLADAAGDWGLGPKSSATLQTAAALLAFGLIEDSGSGEGRKVKVSDLGWRILEDQRPGVKERLLAEAALKPKLIAEYAVTWRDGRPDDAHCISDLKFDKGFNDDAASRFLRVFDETIRFTKPISADSVSEPDVSEADEQPPATRFGGACVGDLIQWEAGGVLQLEKPTRVRWVSDDSQWVALDGSETGIPMAEIIVQERASPPPGAGAPAVTPPPIPAQVSNANRGGNDAPPLNGMEEDKFSTDEGVVLLRYPDNLSPASVEELETFLQLFIKKAKRRAAN